MNHPLQNNRLFLFRICLLAIILFLLCMIPIKAPAVTQSTVETRLSQLRALAGKYFTTTGDACVSPRESSHGCSLCRVGNVIAQGSAFRSSSGLTKWPSSFSMSHGRYNKNSAFTLVSNGQSCVGFANFAGWYLFADSSSSKVTYSRLLDCRYNEVYLYAKPGDIIASSGHSMVYISGTASKIRVLDCNYSNAPQCKIQEREFSTSNTMVTISRSDSYELSDSDRFHEIASKESADGHRYILVQGRCSWEEANAYVQTNYSSTCHLATINSAEEQSIVTNLVQTWNGRGHGGMAWIGAHYVNGSWQWVNGEDFGSYSNWATSGSTTAPYGSIMGQSNKTRNISYVANKWYAIGNLERWVMPGFIIESTPSAAEMDYFRFENDLLPVFVTQGISYPYYGWCETNVPIAQVDVSLTKNGTLVGGVCWYPSNFVPKTEISFAEIVNGLPFMNTASWATGTYNYSFTYYDEYGNEITTYNCPAHVTTSTCSHSNAVWSIQLSKPTCTEPAEVWTYCDQCHILLEKVSEVATIGHTAGEWETVQEPTETTAGVRELHCSVCGELMLTEALPKLNSLIEYEVIYTGAGVRVRQTPGLSGTQIGLLSKGTHFFVHDGTQVEVDGHTWAYTHTESGIEGYIAINDSSLVQQVSSSSTTDIVFHSQSIDQDTGHIYKLFSGNISWESAKAYAESLGEGWCLACMDGDSDDEQSIIENLVVSFDKACWLGGHNLTGNWMWLSGVPISKNDARWDEGEPSGEYKTSTENYLGIYANNSQTTFSTARKWNDFQLTSTTPKGFVAEYTPPFVEPLSIEINGNPAGMYVGEFASFDYSVWGGVEPYTRIEYEWFYMDDWEKNCVKIGSLEEKQDILYLEAPEYYSDTMYLMIEAEDSEGNMTASTCSIPLILLRPVYEVNTFSNVIFAGQTAQVHIDYDYCDVEFAQWTIDPFNGDECTYRNAMVDSYNFSIVTDEPGLYWLSVGLSDGHETVNVEDTIAIYVLPLPSFRLPSGIQTVSEEAFMGCANLSGTIIIPAGVQQIEADAFANCLNVTGIVIMGNSTLISSNALPHTMIYCLEGSAAAQTLEGEGENVIYMNTLPTLP